MDAFHAIGPEATIILASALLLFILVLVCAGANSFTRGIKAALGDRDPATWTPAQNPVLGRLRRATENLKENLFLFFPVALLVVALDASNSTSAWGAHVWLGARIVHPIAYAMNVGLLRVAAWVAGLVGVGMMASALL